MHIVDGLVGGFSEVECAWAGEIDTANKFVAVTWDLSDHQIYSSNVAGESEEYLIDLYKLYHLVFV